MDRACSEGGGKRGLGPHNSTTQVNPFKIFPKLQRVVGRGLEPHNSTTQLNPFKTIPKLYSRLAQGWIGPAQRVVGRGLEHSPKLIPPPTEPPPGSLRGRVVLLRGRAVRLRDGWIGLAQRVVRTQVCPGVATACSEGWWGGGWSHIVPQLN